MTMSWLSIEVRGLGVLDDVSVVHIGVQVKSCRYEEGDKAFILQLWQATGQENRLGVEWSGCYYPSVGSCEVVKD